MDMPLVTFIILIIIIIIFSIIYLCGNKLCKAHHKTARQQNGFQALLTSVRSIYRDNNFQSIPYPPVTLQHSPEPPGFREEFLSTPLCNAVPHPSTSQQCSRIRSYSADDLPPPYAEAVRQQPQSARKYQSNTFLK